MRFLTTELVYLVPLDMIAWGISIFPNLSQWNRKSVFVGAFGKEMLSYSYWIWMCEDVKPGNRATVLLPPKASEGGHNWAVKTKRLIPWCHFCPDSPVLVCTSHKYFSNESFFKVAWLGFMSLTIEILMKLFSFTLLPSSGSKCLRSTPKSMPSWRADCSD